MEREVCEALQREFDPRFIKQRKGNFGATLDYIEAHMVIQRLNQAFQGDWSFEVSEYTQLEDEVVVLGKLSANGIVKQQFGSSKVTRAKGSDEALCIGDDLKSGASDALKKCSTLLGIGLHLYGDTEATDDVGATEAANAQDSSDMSTMSGNRGTALITKDQMKQIKQLRTQLGWSADDVMDKVEGLFGTREVQSLNGTMATALIAMLRNEEGNGDRPGSK